MHCTRRLWTGWLPAIALVWGFAGCGPDRPETISVTGTVTLDGSPVSGAVVAFTPVGGGRPATGTTDGSGKFTLTTFDDGDGALPGEHLVAVIKGNVGPVEGDPDSGEGEETPSAPTGPEQQTGQWLVPQDYWNFKTSGLSCEVKKGMDPPTFALASADGAATPAEAAPQE
jgi:hypothetical protein